MTAHQWIPATRHVYQHGRPPLEQDIECCEHCGVDRDDEDSDLSCGSVAVIWAAEEILCWAACCCEYEDPGQFRLF